MELPLASKEACESIKSQVGCDCHKPDLHGPLQHVGGVNPESPMMMVKPKVLLPTVDAMAAVPMFTKTEVRTPANQSGNANGICTSVSIGRGAMPMVCAESITGDGTDASPASVP